MVDTIESLYPKIGQSVVDSISDDWTSVQLSAIIKPGVTTLHGYYWLATGVKLSVRPTRQMIVLFNQLHTRMAEEMHDDWTQAIFEMDQSGKFDIKFEYNPEDE